MKYRILINIIYLFVFVIIFFYIKNYITDLNTNVKVLQNEIEDRVIQNDSISKKLDSIAIQKVEIINNIQNRSTIINNLQEVFDTSISNAIIFLNEFGNKKL